MKRKKGWVAYHPLVCIEEKKNSAFKFLEPTPVTKDDKRSLLTCTLVIHTHVYTHTHICACLYKYTFMYVYMDMYMYAYVYLYMCIYIYGRQ